MSIHKIFAADPVTGEHYGQSVGDEAIGEGFYDDELDEMYINIRIFQSHLDEIVATADKGDSSGDGFYIEGNQVFVPLKLLKDALPFWSDELEQLRSRIRMRLGRN